MFKSKILKIHAIILIAGLVFAGFYFIPNAKADESKHIVKWVDSQGVTHYGDKLPAQEAGRNNSEMNTQGVVVKRIVQTDNKVDLEDQERLAAQRKDNILLASYTKAEEIDLARDRNLQMDQAALQALTVQKENVSGRASRNQKMADGFKNRKKPVPAYLIEEQKLAKLESGRIDKQMTERKLSMETTRKRFADEKARFIELKQASAPVASLAPTNPATSSTSTPATKLTTTSTSAKAK
jgi:hypothetical protein